MAQRVLKSGMSGADVRKVKDMLYSLGFYAAGIKITHDLYGSDTVAAVKRFQVAHGLMADGIVGEKTWAALLACGADGGTSSPAAEAPPAVAGTQSAKGKTLAAEMVAYVLSRIGDIYAWGACDLYPITESWIKGRDTSATEAARSIADWKRKQGYGMTDLHAFDCSGLPSVPLKKQGIISAKKDCDGLWAICSKIEKTHLISGDLCFRHSSSDASDKTHVGVYVGAGRVVHAKGRDVGVVLEGIDQSSKTWWQDFARLKAYA